MKIEALLFKTGETSPKEIVIWFFFTNL